jgi:hypothetical protein
LFFPNQQQKQQNMQKSSVMMGNFSGKQGLWQSLFKIFWFVWQTAKSRQYLSNFLFVFSGTGSSFPRRKRTHQ